MRWRNAVAACTLFAGAAHAEVTASNAWVRATAPGQKSAAAYLTLKSTDDAKVLGVTTPAAKSAGLHSTLNRSGVMHMHELDALKLPANRAVELTPGADHIMLMEIAQPLKAGASVPLQFTVEDSRGRRSTVDVKARVIPLVE